MQAQMGLSSAACAGADSPDPPAGILAVAGGALRRLQQVCGMGLPCELHDFEALGVHTLTKRVWNRGSRVQNSRFQPLGRGVFWLVTFPPFMHPPRV